MPAGRFGIGFGIVDGPVTEFAMRGAEKWRPEVQRRVDVALGAD